MKETTTRHRNPDTLRWLFWFCVLNAIDGFQTMLLVGRHGLHVELNPWLAFWMQHYSFAGLWTVKILAIPLVYLFARRLSIHAVQILTLGMTFIVFSNWLTSL